MALADQTDSEQTDGPARRDSKFAPGSTPSTWAGGIVIAAVLGLALMRRSFRRMI